ncbi:LacI family DNA-binding transcriptional regulator [Geminisphaera colitermitum]|uniref:LacI family DNA-binding transcriptional regulator n=1 Tax=Geminisphaera colitermitum TaxID=1148786 RepID=UPI001E304C2B|nr:LacI family DNA-binding transcriptional regulator [Geminisphaera colitermitum]
MNRASLAALVAQKISDELQCGRWTKQLPGERQLATLFQVSRPTLRAALAELEKQGRLRTAHGLRREIVTRPARRSHSSTTARQPVVVMISPRPVEKIDPFVVLQLESLRELLARRGMTFSIEVRPSCYAQDVASALARLTAEVAADVWLLWSSTRTIQEWFLAQKLPHIVFGSAYHAEASLSVDLDNHATARHAAHTLRRLGHRRIALLMPRLGLAGDSMTEDGFRAGSMNANASGSFSPPPPPPPAAAVVAQHEQASVQVDIIRHDSTPDGIRASVDHLLALEPRPTGIFSCRGLHTVAVLTYLHSRGLRIPQDISLISRDEDAALDFVTPAPARYHRSPDKLARAVFRLILASLSGRKITRTTVRIFPEFHPHASLGPPP